MPDSSSWIITRALTSKKSKKTNEKTGCISSVNTNWTGYQTRLPESDDDKLTSFYLHYLLTVSLRCDVMTTNSSNRIWQLPFKGRRQSCGQDGGRSSRESWGACLTLSFPPFLSTTPWKRLSLEKTKGILLFQGFSLSKFILNMQKKLRANFLKNLQVVKRISSGNLPIIF